MATPKKLPSGRWRVLVYAGTVNGKRKYTSITADTKQEAARLANVYQERQSKHIGELSAVEVVRKYIDIKTGVLSETTLNGYEKNLHYYEYFGSVPVLKLQNEDVQLFIFDISKGHSSKTVKNIYTPFSAAVRFFYGYTFHVNIQETAQFERYVPTPEEVQRLINDADHVLKKAIALAAFSSLRRSELCAVKYGDINRENLTIKVSRALVEGRNGKLIEKTTKTPQSTRLAPIPVEVLEIIGEGAPDEYVLEGLTPSALSNRMDTVAKRQNVPCTLHGLRAFFASACHANGVPAVYTQYFGGWKSDYVLKKNYIRTISNYLDENRQKMNGFFSDFFKNSENNTAAP